MAVKPARIAMSANRVVAVKSGLDDIAKLPPKGISVISRVTIGVGLLTLVAGMGSGAP